MPTLRPRFSPQLVALENRITPVAALVSANRAGTDAGNAGSGVTDISADGRFVVFNSNATNLTADTDANNTTDIFVRDTKLNTTALVTKTVSGGAGGGVNGRISADGRYVVWGGDPRGNIGNFMTSPFATDGKLNPMENGGGHVYRTDLQTGQTIVVDISPSSGISGKGGFGAGGLGGTFDISDDGNIVAFTYVGHDLLPGDAPTSNVDFDLYVRDIAAGTTKLVNHTPGGGFSAVTAFNGDLVVSGNGKTILFETTATDLVTQTDTNSVLDLFAYDVATGVVKLVSVTADGTTATGGGATDGRFRADIDAGGNLVTIAVNNAAPELVVGVGTGDQFSGDLYLRDLSAGKTTLVTRSPATGKTGAAFLAGAGTGAAFNDISADGKYIAILGSVGLIPGESFAFARILYVYEVATGRFSSAINGPDGTRLDLAGTGTISADGRYVTFVGNGGFAAGVTFVPGATNTGTAYVYDRLADRTFAVATDAAGAKAFGNNGFGNDLTPFLSADGKRVAFSNSEPLGGATDTNNTNDVYINDVPQVPPLVPTAPSLLPSPVLVGFPQIVIGADGGSDVRFINAITQTEFAIDLGPQYLGGVRVAGADFTGDGVADLVAGTGPGGPTEVRVIDGVTKAVLFTIAPFEATFTGGVYVAAGDVTGDGIADLIITPDEGGGPRVRIFNGKDFKQLADFFGIDDPAFRGGARAAVGDLNGDGVADLLVAAGFGGGPRVAGFNGKNLGEDDKKKLFGDFLAFEAALRNGTFVAFGDINGDGRADLIAGGGPGGGPRVMVLDGQGLLDGKQTVLANFFAGNAANRGGVRVAVRNLDGDKQGDLVVGDGTGAGTRVTSYLGKTITPDGTPPEFFGLDAFPGRNTGIFVG